MGGANTMYRAEVRVGFKEGVADPEGENTRKTLGLLGFDEVAQVRAAKVFEIEVDVDDEATAKQRVQEMCDKLLANPVVNDYSVEVTPA